MERNHPSNDDRLERVNRSQLFEGLREKLSNSIVPGDFVVAAHQLTAIGLKLKLELYPYEGFWGIIADRLLEKDFGSERNAEYAVKYTSTASALKLLTEKNKVDALNRVIKLEHSAKISIQNALRKLFCKPTISQDFPKIREWVEEYFDDPRKIERIATIARELTETT